MNEPSTQTYTLWQVSFTLPKTEERKWVLNKREGVAADTLEIAIAEIKKLYPDCRLISAVNGGSLHIIAK